MKYFIKIWWESSGETSILVEEEYKNKAEARAESLRKQIISKLKELGSEGNYSDVKFRVEKIDKVL